MQFPEQYKRKTARPINYATCATIANQQKMRFSSVTFLAKLMTCLLSIYSGHVTVNAQAAAWPATSYSPFFQNLFAQASAPVAALPSGPGAQAPAIPVPGGPGPAFNPAFGPPGR